MYGFVYNIINIITKAVNGSELLNGAMRNRAKWLQWAKVEKVFEQIYT